MALKAAVIGCGTIAESAHLPALKEIPNVTVEVLVDLSRMRARRLARKFSVETIYEDYQDMLDSSDLDFAVITVPPSYHSRIAIECMESGLNVLIEKPLASTVKEARAIVDVASRTGLTAGVVHNRRFYWASQSAKRSINSGNYGEIYQSNFASIISGPSVGYPASEWHFDKTISGGGVIMDQGIHTVDLIRWLLGEIKCVFTVTSDVLEDFDVDVGASAVLQTSNGVNCTMDLSWVNDFTLFPFTLWGTSGALFAEPLYGYYEEVHGPRNPVRRWHTMSQTLLRFAYNYATEKHSPTHLALISNFVSSLRTGKPPLVDSTDGLRSVEIVEALYRSASDGRMIRV